MEKKDFRSQETIRVFAPGIKTCEEFQENLQKTIHACHIDEPVQKGVARDVDVTVVSLPQDLGDGVEQPVFFVNVKAFPYQQLQVRNLLENCMSGHVTVFPAEKKFVAVPIPDEIKEIHIGISPQLGALRLFAD